MSIFNTEIIKKMPSFFLVFISSVFSGLALVFLTSNRAHWIDNGALLYLVNMLQLEALAVTLIKLGFDQYIYAKYADLKKAPLPSLRALLFRTSPLTFFFFLYLWFSFGPLLSLLVMLATLLDVSSIIFVSYFNAYSKYYKGTISAWLNYPVFFIAIYVFYGVGLKVNILEITVAFLFSSFTRFVYLLLAYQRLDKIGAGIHYTMRDLLALGAQQTMNFLLFKVDQVFIYNEKVSNYLHVNSVMLPEYNYLSRLIDLFNSFYLIVGIYLFKNLRFAVFSKFSKSILGLLLYFGLNALMLGGGVLFFKGELNLALIFPFFLRLVLILPTNYLTYYLIKNSKFRVLNFSLIMVMGLMLIALISLQFMHLSFLIAYIVPGMMVLFITINLLLIFSRSLQHC